MGISNNDCKLCTKLNIDVTNDTKDLLLIADGVKRSLNHHGRFNDGCKMGYTLYPQHLYWPDNYGHIQPVCVIPASGGNINFKLESLCEYPLWSGTYPPSGPFLGKLTTSGAYSSTNYGYDITINFPPYNGVNNGFMYCTWCGSFYASDSQFSEECQQIDTPYQCEFFVRFTIKYDVCQNPCLVQTVDTPSTRLNAIVDEQNIYWPLDNGVFTDCIPNSTGTKNAINKIKAKLIEIDNFYNNCLPPTQRTLTAQAIPDTNGNCIRFSAKGFKTKFRILHWGGANDPAFFNHDGC